MLAFSFIALFRRWPESRKGCPRLLREQFLMRESSCADSRKTKAIGFAKEMMLRKERKAARAYSSSGLFIIIYCPFDGT